MCLGSFGQNEYMAHTWDMIQAWQVEIRMGISTRIKTLARLK